MLTFAQQGDILMLSLLFNKKSPGTSAGRSGDGLAWTRKGGIYESRETHQGDRCFRLQTGTHRETGRTQQLRAGEEDQRNERV